MDLCCGGTLQHKNWISLDLAYTRCPRPCIAWFGRFLVHADVHADVQADVLLQLSGSCTPAVLAGGRGALQCHVAAVDCRSFWECVNKYVQTFLYKQ